ncbi:MAG TPA: flagellar assembly protein FliH, partial [Chitinolyticbacter sp.]|nr:flagellar assembly protein FliH [Chitinolyticbacter sp.]
ATRFETELADQTLDLALVIARQLAREAVSADRALLLPLVREALAGLPPVKAPARLLLNPDDMAALEVQLTVELPPEVWRLVPDPTMESGGCRIDTANTRIELTLAERWAHLTRVLGRQQRPDLAWHAPAAEREPPVAPLAAEASPAQIEPDATDE